LRTRFGSERGTAIVTVIALMTAMIAAGLATYSFADTQQVQSTRERQQESSFNFAEAALSNQAFILSRRWPGTAARAYPDCTQSAADPVSCPQPAQLGAAYDTRDYAAGTAWSTAVRDDSGTGATASLFYDPEDVLDNEPWDANGNDRVWIRSQAIVRGRRRTLVALVQIQKQSEVLPRRTIIAGKFRTGQNGNQTYVTTNPDQTSRHPVTVRCSSRGPNCADYKRGRNIDPPDEVAYGEYVGRDVLEDDAKERLKERAMADGTFFTGCPSDAELSGDVVWVEGCPDGQYTGAIVNSSARPGMLIWYDGKIRFTGNTRFYGILYNLNESNSSDYVVDIQGSTCIFGGIYVDGPGGVEIGSNSCGPGDTPGNIDFNANAFGLVASYGAAGLVQNSWREVTE
jgi:hypothetical protein